MKTKQTAFVNIKSTALNSVTENISTASVKKVSV